MTKASQVPAMVAAHQEALLSTPYTMYAARFFKTVFTSKHNLSPGDMETLARYARNWCQLEADSLNIAQLFHITESMTEVAKVAAMHLPEDNLTLTTMDLPARTGVLVFEQPLYVRDVWDKIVGISMVHWLHDRDGKLCFGMFTDVRDGGDQYNLVMKAKGNLDESAGRWSLMNYAQPPDVLQPWFHGDEAEILDYRANHTNVFLEHPEVSYEESTIPQTVPSVQNVHRILYAIYSLMEQPIAAQTQETDRRLARRNRNKTRPPAMVTVIQLRRREAHGKHDAETGRWLTYRSVTRGHWRNQPCGPGRSEIKRIWINSYTRGGEDLPFHQPARVNTLAR